MNLHALADRLQDADIGLDPDQIFINFMPSDARAGALFKLPLTGVPIDHELPGFYRTRLQIIIRNQSRSVGDQLAAAAMQTMTIEQSEWVGDMHVRYLRPTTLPISFPRSEGNGIEWSLNFMMAYDQT